MSHLRLPPYQKTQRKSYAGFPTASAIIPSPTSTFSSSFQLVAAAPTSSSDFPTRAIMANEKIPIGYVAMENQVAGHTFQVGTNEIGMLKSIDDGSVLKPGGNPMCAAREIKFYEHLLTSTDPNILPLKEFIPEFRGTVDLTVGQKTIKFIKLHDLTHGMLEPCVIDLKIGRRTYDPLASDQKRDAEESKYQQCKKTVGFCIPGFQIYQISSGSYKKFGKEYGKKLNENTIREALRLFLNAESGLNRQLVTSILTSLWAIQKWMRSQKQFQFYSSSILIVYDARKLRSENETKNRQTAIDSNNGGISAVETSSLDSNALGSSNSVGLSGSSTDESINDGSKYLPKSVYKKIQRSHSSTNNYEHEMRKMKNSYQQMLDNLVGTYDGKREWVHVKMIDFAHTFNSSEFPEAALIDANYLNGIEHLVSIFEDLLKTCD